MTLPTPYLSRAVRQNSTAIEKYETRIAIKWFWCESCMTQTDQMFEREDTGDTIYRCCSCGNEKKIGAKP